MDTFSYIKAPKDKGLHNKNVLITGSIPITLAQTYCKYLVLNSIQVQKKCSNLNFERGLLGLYFGAEDYFSQRVQNLNDFTVSASSKKSAIFFLIHKYFTYIIYDTSS
jgi:hypothetical protein